MKKEQEEKVSWGPLLLVFLYIGFVFIIRSKLPPADEMIQIISSFYQSYGYLVVFVSGLIEASFVVGMYFPGSAAILLGAVVAKSGTVSLPLIILLGTIGLMLGYTANYFMGKQGRYKVLEKFGIKEGIKQAEAKLSKHGGKALFLGYMSPNSGSLLSTAAGVLQLPFKKFFITSFLSQLFWSTIWGSIAYTFGATFVELFLQYFAVAVVIIIAVWFGWQWIQKKRSIKK